MLPNLSFTHPVVETYESNGNQARLSTAQLFIPWNTFKNFRSTQIMITGIEIENFKGVGDRIRLDMRPITLLFGGNSSGKSTCIHALHYAREIFLQGNLDPKETTVGGKFIDLGGFKSLVHGRDLTRAVKIRIDMQLDEGLISQALGRGMINIQTINKYVGSKSRSLLKPNALKTAAVELTVSWNTMQECAYISSHKTFLNGELFADVTIDSSLRDIALTTNKEHPVLAKLSGTLEPEDQQKEVDPENNPTFLSHAQDAFEKVMTNRSSRGLPLQITDPFSNKDRRCIYDFVSEKNVSRNVSFPAIKKLKGQTRGDYHEVSRFASAFTRSLWKLIFGPCYFLKTHLKSLLYLGRFEKRLHETSNHHPYLMNLAGHLAWVLGMHFRTVMTS